MHKRTAFTLIELLVVISVISLLMAILIPVLSKAREQGKSVVCRGNLRTLALANELYAGDWDGWYVPVIDETMVGEVAFCWNSNNAFRRIVGLSRKREGAERFVLPEEYWCPSDRMVRNEAYWADPNVQYVNRVSYGYNLTDWGRDSKNPYQWTSGDMVDLGRYCGFKVGQFKNLAAKLMFIDAGDFWVEMRYANFKRYWNRWGQDILQYRAVGVWGPTFYRHSEGANIAFFDGHVEYLKKENVFFYYEGTSFGDNEKNAMLWFCKPSNMVE